MDDVYEEYLRNRELFGNMDITITNPLNGIDHVNSHISFQKTIGDIIVKGRELSGESGDFNY